MLQQMMTKVIKDTHAARSDAMEMMLSDCLHAADEMNRHGSYAPTQWVLSCFPRAPATVGDEDECQGVGALQAHADGPIAFGVQSRYLLKQERLSYDGIVVSECDVLLCVKLHLQQDRIRWEAQSRLAEKRERVSMELQWSVKCRLTNFEKKKSW